jgi:hypothetical protein
LESLEKAQNTLLFAARTLCQENAGKLFFDLTPKKIATQIL